MDVESMYNKTMQHFDNIAPKIREIIFQDALEIHKKVRNIIEQEFNMKPEFEFLSGRKVEINEALIYIEAVTTLMGNLLANILATNKTLGELYSKQEIMDNVDFTAGYMLQNFNNKLYQEINSKDKFKTLDEVMI